LLGAFFFITLTLESFPFEELDFLERGGLEDGAFMLSA